MTRTQKHYHRICQSHFVLRRSFLFFTSLFSCVREGERVRRGPLEQTDSGDATASSPTFGLGAPNLDPSPSLARSRMPPGSHDPSHDPRKVGSLISPLGGTFDPFLRLPRRCPMWKRSKPSSRSHARLGAIEGRRYHEDTNADRWEVRGITSHLGRRT